MDYNMNLNEHEIRTVYAIFSELQVQLTEQELIHIMGSVGVEEMNTIRSKIKTNEYCKLNGIKYEDMNEDDWNDYYAWRERIEQESYADCDYDEE